MAAGGQTYNVYVHSYLNYGLMMGRGAVLTLPDASACLPKGVSGVYKCALAFASAIHVPFCGAHDRVEKKAC